MYKYVTKMEETVDDQELTNMQPQFVLFVLTVTIARETIADDQRPNADLSESCRSFFLNPQLKKCCKPPTDLKQPGTNVTIAVDCHYKITAGYVLPIKPEDRLEILECISDCYLNATNQLTADMKLIPSIFIANNEKQFANYPKWKEAGKSAIDTCLSKDISQQVKPDAKCKSGSYQFSTCVGIQLFLKCPDDAWEDTDECRNAKETIERCQDVMPF